MEIALIIILTVFAAIALVVWWMLDIDIADIVAMIVSPIVGVWLIYYYATPLAWAAGIVLLGIGVFALYFLIDRRRKPPA
jgi:hypothetical protein